MLVCQSHKRPLTWCAPQYCPMCRYPPCQLVLATCTVQALLALAQPLVEEDDQSAWVRQQWKALMQAIDHIAIDRPPSSASHARRMKVEEDIWHRFETAAHRYENAVLPKAPAAEFCFLLRTAADKRLHSLRRLMVPQPTLEAIATTCDFEQYDRIFLAGLRVMGAASLTLSTTAELHALLKQAAQAMRHALFEGLIWQTGACMDLPISEVQDWGAFTFSGWIASKISLAENQRLKALLEQELRMRGEYPPAPRNELYERLPPNTYRAWREVEGKTLAKLPTRIAFLVEHDIADQSPQKAIPGVSFQAEPQPLDTPLYEEVARKLHEEDQYWAWLNKAAALSPLEADVTRLKCQDAPPEHPGADYTEHEIAARLGRSLGSVKQAWQRAQPKIKRVLKRGSQSPYS
jgi:hypothetical protein